MCGNACIEEHVWECMHRILSVFTRFSEREDVNFRSLPDFWREWRDRTASSDFRNAPVKKARRPYDSSARFYACLVVLSAFPRRFSGLYVTFGGNRSIGHGPMVSEMHL